LALGGVVEQAAEKLVEGIKSAPQALKRGHILNDLTARVKLVPFPFVEGFFFRNYLFASPATSAGNAHSAHLNLRATLEPEMNTAVKPISKILHLTVLIVLCNSLLLAADRGTLVREAVLYLSPDTTSNKLAQVERGREVILLDKSHDWLHVEALLGSSLAPDPAFVLEDEERGKTITGWVLDNGVVWASTPEGDRILFGAAVDSEEEASRRRGRRGAAQDALRLYRRVYDIFPTAPLAGEALYRAADIRWQIEKSDMLSRPSARERDPNLRQGIDEESMKLVMKKFPDSKWAQLAAFHLIDNKLCGDWQGSSKCPDKEADIYEKYVKEHPESPAAAEALYNAASRRAALIEIYKTEDQAKKSEQSKSLAIGLAQQLISKYPQSDWSSRGQTLLFMVQQGVPTYGNAIE
jgi:outer membrane protein assembly factor BamD (BamD/ComL family)